MVDFKKSVFLFDCGWVRWLAVAIKSLLSSETVKGAALSLEGVDDVKGSNSLAASMLSVGNCVSDNVLKEDFQHATSLFVDETGDTLDTTTTSQSADGRLGDALDVVS